MSPEYAINGSFSVKSDVFSFGVIVIEILSGLKIRKFCHPDCHHNLLGHVSLQSITHTLFILYPCLIARMLLCSLMRVT